MSAAVQFDPVAAGNRLQSARTLAGMNRNNFASTSEISAATLRVWEKPTNGRYGLTVKGAKRIVESLRKLNIHCSVEWLLYGKGDSPKLFGIVDAKREDSVMDELGWGFNEYQDDVQLLKDVEAFKANNKDAVVLQVMDDALAPYYNLGDFVGGIKKVAIRELEKAYGKICIIENNQGLSWVRILQGTDEPNKVVAAAALGSQAKAIVLDIDNIALVVPVVWSRCVL